MRRVGRVQERRYFVEEPIEPVGESIVAVPEWVAIRVARIRIAAVLTIVSIIVVLATVVGVVG